MEALNNKTIQQTMGRWLNNLHDSRFIIFIYHLFSNHLSFILSFYHLFSNYYVQT